MKHRAASRFWDCYDVLLDDIQRLADRCFNLLRRNPRHPSLHFKRIGNLWSVRVGLQHRALAAADDEGPIWFWIGSHDQYERLIRQQS